MDKLKESLQILDELLRKAYELISPLDMHSDLKWYLNRDMRKAQMEKFPKCFVTIQNKMGRQIPFPICNVMGMTCPKMIDFSMKLANKLNQSDDFDNEVVVALIGRLKRLHSRFDKDVPTPAPEAARKAGTTKGLNTIANYLKGLK